MLSCISTNYSFILDRLPDVIGNIIFKITAMEKIALMLAAPENIISCCLTKCKNYQKAMQNEILKVTSQPVPDAVNLNISWSQLGVDRRSRVKLALQAIIARFELDAIFRIAVKMCRLKGLLLSIQNPNAYIKKVILDDDGKCVLTDIDENIYIHNSVWDPSMESILHSS
ncbi:uncharacterized protein LOC126844011 isoform X1 [Adelges cooleyi]|uniref:uncharacterized protein LOC126844011 isoform X1 n=1 Tax=Adelges cooleyi TaxID=133065 RepID=UPI00217F8DD9|nr:uncharacterized protein LOC126844011 isoform X1 [Adelges cooleyi]